MGIAGGCLIESGANEKNSKFARNPLWINQSNVFIVNESNPKRERAYDPPCIAS